MMACKYEGTGHLTGRCIGTYEVDPCRSYDKCEAYSPNYITNAARIRTMNDEELAKFLSNPCSCEVDPETDGYRECGNELCIQYLLKWLKQPAEEDTE